jgi:hypothetical protein
MRRLRRMRVTLRSGEKIETLRKPHPATALHNPGGEDAVLSDQWQIDNLYGACDVRLSGRAFSPRPNVRFR